MLEPVRKSRFVLVDQVFGSERERKRERKRDRGRDSDREKGIQIIKLGRLRLKPIVLITSVFEDFMN